MASQLQPDLDQSISRRFGMLSDDARVRRTAAALEANGISVLRAANAAEAKRVVLDLIPDGSQVHNGASQSLEAAGITDELEKSGRYELLRPRIWSMDRKTQADEIRRLSAAPEVMLGSVHAVTETGSLVAASASGSQLGPYAAGAGKVILVVGTQKIVSDLAEALRRVDRLVDEGLVRRTTPDADARGVVVVLTDVGVARLKEALPVHMRGVRDLFVARLSDQELAVLEAALDKVALDCTFG